MPIAHLAFRLNLLNEAALKARDRENYSLMMQVLEQAAKEVGGSLTNKCEIDLTDSRQRSELSLEERIERVGRLFDEAMEREQSRLGSQGS